ncbi:glycosyltransferase [Streptomyces sp. NRRL B-24720]|uniref:glycosyltransferase n=1 Tax=Streptomyces sp. NRRL B-24720 TaxID=1476876 RepID=UPI00068A891F|nr:glycosyltransferase [Streptomyces sp. NRRL B-24720]
MTTTTGDAAQDLRGPGPATPRDIFFVSNSVDELGGVTTWSHQMARLLLARGHRVHMVGITASDVPQDLGGTLPYPTTTLYDTPPPEPAPSRGLRGRLDPVARRRNRLRAAGMRERAAELTRLFASARPGAVVIVTQVWAMEWVALARTRGLTVIGMSHESYLYSRSTSRFARVKRHYADVDRMLVLTREDADLWIREGMNNVGFMPNPLPFLPSTPSPRARPVVLSMGRLTDQKGIDMLLDAWAEVAPHHPEWTLEIYGDGEDEEDLRTQSCEAGLDGSVQWRGRTADVQGALNGGSIFVQSSRGEGFPLALMEAMAAGLPSVAFDCAPGVREIVSDGQDGLLAPLGSTRELAAHLRTLISDSALRDRMGDAARENVRRFSTDRVVRRWEELFAFLDQR